MMNSFTLHFTFCFLKVILMARW